MQRLAKKPCDIVNILRGLRRPARLDCRRAPNATVKRQVCDDDLTSFEQCGRIGNQKYSTALSFVATKLQPRLTPSSAIRERQGTAVVEEQATLRDSMLGRSLESGNISPTGD